MGGCCAFQHHQKENKHRKVPAHGNKMVQKAIVARSNAKGEGSAEEDAKLLSLYTMIRQNQHFNLLLDGAVLDEIHEDVRTSRWSKQAKNALVQLLQNHIRFSTQAISVKSTHIRVPFQYNVSDYGQFFGKNVWELKNNFSSRNNCHVRTLNYFDQFKNYKFTLEDSNKKQLQELEKRVKDLSEYDTCSVFYLMSYLKKSCKNMQNQGQSPKQINKKLKKCVDGINQNFATKASFEIDMLYLFLFEQGELEKFKNEQRDYDKIKIHLKEKDKKKELNKKIAEIAKLAKQAEEPFFNLTYTACVDNRGFGYSVNTKIQDAEDQTAIKRVKEKLFKDKIEKQYKNKEFKSKTIKKLRKEQYKYKKEVMSKIYSELDQIDFNVTDLIRGRCFFKRFSQINKATTQIINNIKQSKEGQEVELIQIDNRLKTTTNDIVLKIRIGKIVAQFQLGLRFKETESQVYHKMYEISRSEMLSPIVQLYNVEKAITNEYFHSLQEDIESMNEPMAVKSDIKKKQKELQKFIQLDEEKDDDSSDDEKGISPHALYTQIYKQDNLSSRKIEELKKGKLIRTGDYYKQVYQHDRALNFYKKQLEINEAWNNGQLKRGIRMKMNEILKNRTPDKAYNEIKLY